MERSFGGVTGVEQMPISRLVGFIRPRGVTVGVFGKMTDGEQLDLWQFFFASNCHVALLSGRNISELGSLFD